MGLALALSSLVVAYNNLVNRWGPFHGTAYVPLNLSFTGFITLLSTAILNLSRDDLGLQGDMVDAAVALGAVGLFGIVAFAFARSRHSHRIADRRVTDLRGRRLAYHVLLRIPIGTAVAEEMLFRGVLFAVWRGAGLSTLGAALGASFAFGLWHISPTILGIRINDAGVSGRKLRVAVAGAVLATTLAGLALTWLRLRSDGLIAPIMLHGGINSLGALAAVVAGRRIHHM